MKKILVILMMCMPMLGVTVQVVADATHQRIEAVAPQPDAQGGVGHITFVAGSNDAVFNIYSITGQLIKVVRVAADQRATIDIPKGFYIVKCSNQWSRKVVVK